MVFTFVNILFLVIVITGLGLLFPWNVYRIERRLEALFLSFWLGWAIFITFLQIWHFFWPVGLPSFLLLIAGGAAGWLRNGKVVAEMASRWDRKATYITAGLALVPALMVANHVMFFPPNSDYALYHLQSVKWISTYSVIPGLSNLFNPLAMNCSNFLYTAAIDSAWLEGRAYYVSNTLLAYVTILQCAAGLYRILFGNKVTNPDLFLALMLPLVLMNVSTTHLVAYSADPIVFFLHVILGAELLRFFEKRDSQELYLRRSVQLIFLAATALTVKLSLAVFGVLCLLPVVVLGIARYGWLPWKNPRIWLRWFAIGAVLVVPWIARNVFLSGYPLYPSTMFPAPVPWKMAQDMAVASGEAIRFWARTHNAAFPFADDAIWFSQWWNSFPFFARQAFLFGLGLLVLNQAVMLLFRRRAVPNLGAAVLSMIAIAGIGAWFVTAPSYRHSGALIWIFLIAEVLVAFHLMVSAGLVKRPQVIAYALILLITFWQPANQFSNNISRRQFFIAPTEAALAEQAVPLSAYRQWVTNHGLVVNIPPEGIQECWNAPLPCTTAENFLPSLLTIKPGDLQSGFIRIK